MSQPAVLTPAKPVSESELPLPAFALAFLAAAMFALTSRYPGYVHHDTAEIAMWSTLGWPLGLPKHPPFLPWLFRVYSYVVPLNWVSIGVLTAGNIVLGAWAVYQIARLALDERRAALAAFLYGLAPAGTFFALKLNHNGILVSLWPLTILAFLICLKAKTTVRSLVAGHAFGAMAAAGMLAKYYTGVLLASCVLAWIASPQRDRFLRGPGGYAAVLTFALLFAPHALWMWNESGGTTLSYALHATERESWPLLHFVTMTPLYLIPPIAGYLVLRRWIGSPTPGTTSVSALPELAVLSLAPFLLTAAFIATFKLRGATSWSLPDFCVVPVVFASTLAIPSGAALATLKRIAGALLVTVALLGPVVLAVAFELDDPNAVEPRAEVAIRAGRIFEAATGRPIAFVAGDPQSANSAALAIPSRPLVFSNFDLASAPWATPEAIARNGLLIICRPRTGCDELAEAFARNRRRFGIHHIQQRGWRGRSGPLVHFTVIVIPPEGSTLDQAAWDAAVTKAGASP